MTAITYLNASQKIHSVLRRFFLVRLLGHHKRIQESWSSHATAAVNTASTVQQSWVLNQMMIQIDSTVIHPNQQVEASPQYKADRKHLQNQLRNGQNYRRLADRFGPAILALVLTDSEGGCSSTLLVFFLSLIWIVLTSNRVEKTHSVEFEELVDLLDEHRGAALRANGELLNRANFLLCYNKTTAWLNIHLRPWNLLLWKKWFWTEKPWCQQASLPRSMVQFQMLR